MLASMGQSCARECVWTACTIMGQCAGPGSGHISFTRIDVVFVPSSTKDILILKSLPIGLGGEGSLHEHSSVGMSEAQWKDYTYLSRELVVHPVLGMDTDHSLRWAADVAAEEKMVICAIIWISKRKYDPVLPLWQVIPGKVEDGLGLGSGLGQGKCHKAQPQINESKFRNKQKP